MKKFGFRTSLFTITLIFLIFACTSKEEKDPTTNTLAPPTDPIATIDPAVKGWHVATKEHQLTISVNETTSEIIIVCDIINMSNCPGIASVFNHDCLRNKLTSQQLVSIIFKAREHMASGTASCNWQDFFPAGVDITCLPDSIGSLLCEANFACLELSVADAMTPDDVLQLSYVEDNINNLPMVDFRKRGKTNGDLANATCHALNTLNTLTIQPNGRLLVKKHSGTDTTSFRNAPLYIYIKNNQLCLAPS